MKGVGRSPWVQSGLALVLVGCGCPPGLQRATFPSGGGACVSQPVIDLTYCMEHAGLKAALNRLGGKLKVGGVGEVEAVKETAVEFSQTEQRGAMDACLRDFYAARGLPPAGTFAPGGPANAGQEFMLFDVNSKATGAERVRRQVGTREASAVLRLVFPRFMESRDGCGDAGGTMVEQRAAGFIVPAVQSAADGSFTDAGKTERLYEIKVGECWASHADGWGSVLLIVVRDGVVVAREFVSGGSSVHTVVDVDEDGRDELVVTASGTAQGTISEVAMLESMGPRGLVQRHDFGLVYENTCDGVTRPEDGGETSTTAIARRSLSGEVSFSTTTRKKVCK